MQAGGLPGVPELRAAQLGVGAPQRCSQLCYSPGVRRADLIVNPISGTGEALRAASLTVAFLEKRGVRVRQRVTEAAGPGPPVRVRSRPRLRRRHHGRRRRHAQRGPGRAHSRRSGRPRPDRDGERRVTRPPTSPSTPSAPRSSSSRACRGDRRRQDQRPPLRRDGRRRNRRRDRERRSARRARARSRSSPTSCRPSGDRELPAGADPLTVDGTKVDAVFYGVFVTNTRNYGGFFSVTPSAAIDDGALNWAGQTSPRRSSLAPFRDRRAPAQGASHDARRVTAPGGRSSSRRRGPIRVPVEVDGDFFGYSARDDRDPSGRGADHPSARTEPRDEGARSRRRRRDRRSAPAIR